MRIEPLTKDGVHASELPDNVAYKKVRGVVCNGFVMWMDGWDKEGAYKWGWTAKMTVPAACKCCIDEEWIPLSECYSRAELAEQEEDDEP